MIHNCWVAVMGNRNDLIQTAQDMAPFDQAMADIYAARSGQSGDDIAAMMDNETYISGSDAVDKGFADRLLPADEVQDGDDNPAAALRKLDALLAKANTPRSERRKLLKALTGYTPGAVTDPAGTPSATIIDKESVASLEAAFNGLKAACQ